MTVHNNRSKTICISTICRNPVLTIILNFRVKYFCLSIWINICNLSSPLKSIFTALIIIHNFPAKTSIGPIRIFLQQYFCCRYCWSVACPSKCQANLSIFVTNILWNKYIKQLVGYITCSRPWARTSSRFRSDITISAHYFISPETLFCKRIYLFLGLNGYLFIGGNVWRDFNSPIVNSIYRYIGITNHIVSIQLLAYRLDSQSKRFVDREHIVDCFVLIPIVICNRATKSGLIWILGSIIRI